MRAICDHLHAFDILEDESEVSWVIFGATRMQQSQRITSSDSVVEQENTEGVYGQGIEIEVDSCWAEQVPQVDKQLEGCLPDVCLPADLHNPVRGLLAEKY